ncbi:MAG: DUF4168 domain-containing protein [Symploca sp. SIO3C6]|uniref:DUF4168 domain-containing protein n=1 Tax=Symploca sp. SIO1C4 TaxID=2607765 RepID=A0A6B3NNK8_9CYAN|nr:DUF4168 domain-containing protein [Symploca sp. SIO3C6]NER31131.1 DUF4168 domain-containing protein [Symploca sp. SIO1C4]NET04785.1 DUF4168 domain-containing protein [Symploca sp. SIO2B6]
MVPIWAGCSSEAVYEPPTPIPTLSAVSEEEVENYSRAILAIEQSRQAAAKDILETTQLQTVPDINCTQSETIEVLEGTVQEIAIKYCNDSKKVIEDTQNLTVDQFNAISSTAQLDQNLQIRIQNELIRLQQ